MKKFHVSARGYYQACFDATLVRKAASWQLEAPDEVTASKIIKTREELGQWGPGTTWETQEISDWIYFDISKIHS